jgi:hypothetical protein
MHHAEIILSFRQGPIILTVGHMARGLPVWSLVISHGSNVRRNLLSTIVSPISGKSMGTAAVGSCRVVVVRGKHHIGGAIAGVGSHQVPAVAHALTASDGLDRSTLRIACCASRPSCHSITARIRIRATTAIFLCLGLRETIR